LHRPAVVAYTGIPGFDTALPIKKPEFSFLNIVHAIKVLHELEDGFLFMPVLWQCCSDGNDLTQ
jgi:hypothetical protein